MRLLFPLIAATMKTILNKIVQGLSKSQRVPNTRRKRLSLTKTPARIYAIGDVHGCAKLQRRLEEQIITESAKAENVTIIVYLGDLVDRGLLPHR